MIKIEKITYFFNLDSLTSPMLKMNMATIQAKKISANVISSIPSNWEKSKDVYTGDDLIDAFLKGKEAGQNEHYRILSTQLKENINKAANLSEKLFKEVLKNNITPLEVHLKADDITKYKALFFVKKSDFVSDSFREVYTISRKIKTESESEKFYITFSFTPISDNFNEHCLLADGYFMKYEKK